MEKIVEDTRTRDVYVVDKQRRLLGVVRMPTVNGLLFPMQALDQADINVRPGQVTGLIGPDGACKTTLMRLTAGLLHPDDGSIHVLGINVVQELQRVQSSIG